ncbi:disease resistance protein RUN1 [Lactuca sativa]|uniref:disease resistance protein RUN1 n=1 Tax=Lactuca sativa TaxID=4236 RepID=UPI001C69034E|nr:disease resistance protein RUN1 [Lactuca sativa]XP_042758725.1 disease resistance protein RUN1 [Lactuca sativa]XP_042758726.1 disease resistance protein RUN1 [Lactuca sativa]XP_042758727.1 disease resistance protein RUN1 [Lactuca sativa]XP_042758728.1 disease resistance protein RUN1 [Lactuca sativa]
MGGIGKTTIAKCIFNTNSSFYEDNCFLADINKMVSNQDKEMCRLQSQLLSTILKNDKEETIWNVHEGTDKVTKVISNKKVLVILDYVATRKQLDALLGPKRFYPGSKVIITTRHKDLLTAFSVHPQVHPVGTLSADDAIELFCLYSFHQHQPVEPYISQSQVFVHHCKRLPLALKVLGSSLCGKTIDEWEDTMRQVAANPDPVEIQEVLEISYTNLKCDMDKSIFLHIACFLEGEEKDYIIKLLAQCDLYTVVGIRNLMYRCLVYVEDGRVMMHQLIKEMGREVVRKESPKEPGKRSRLWHHQDCIDVLQDQSGTGKVEGLRIDLQKTEEADSTSAITINNPRKHSLEGKRMHGNDANFEIGALEKMKNLMLLQLNYVMFSGTCRRTLPRKLRLLRWHGCPLEAIPSESCLKKLVVLDMSHSKLKRVWDDLEFLDRFKAWIWYYHCLLWWK